MWRTIAGVLIAVCIADWAALAAAETQTVTGTVVSLSCYFNDKKNIGKAGALCENATVKYEGNPVGIVSEDGKVYQLAGGLVANNNAKVIPLLGQSVTVRGDVTQKAGISVLSADDASTVK